VTAKPKLLRGLVLPNALGFTNDDSWPNGLTSSDVCGSDCEVMASASCSCRSDDVG